MKHIKNIKYTDIESHSKKKADAASARHHASQHVRHLVLLETRLASRRNN